MPGWWALRCVGVGCPRACAYLYACACAQPPAAPPPVVEELARLMRQYLILVLKAGESIPFAACTHQTALLSLHSKHHFLLVLHAQACYCIHASNNSNDANCGQYKAKQYR